MASFKIIWQDSGKEPMMPPNPDYPAGIDLDLTAGHRPACYILLPYPALRIGRYLIACETCGFTCFVTTAGRPDDPRSLKMACLTPTSNSR